MKTDDPKFTAYALDELEPAERAEIEALLATAPALCTELAEIRSFAAKLRTELHAEEGAPLTVEQRAELLGEAASVVEMPRAWWSRPWVQSAAAACVIIGASALLLSRVHVPTPLLAQRGEPAHEVSVNTASSLGDAPDAPAPDPLEQLSTESLAEQKLELSPLSPAPSASLAMSSAGEQAELEFRRLARNRTDSAADFGVELHSPVLLSDSEANQPLPSAGPAGAVAAPALPAQKPAAGAPLSTAGIAQIEASRGDADAAGVRSKEDRLDVDRPQKKSRQLEKRKSVADLTKLAELTAGRPAGPSAAAPGEWDRGVSSHGGADGARSLNVSPAEPAAAAKALPYFRGRSHEENALAAAVPLAPAAREALGVPAGGGTARGARRVELSDLADARFAGGVVDGEARLRPAIDGLEREQLGRSNYRFYNEQETASNTEAYDSVTDNAFLPVKDQPLSTFSIDVDSASYANVRRFLNNNERPPKGAVRIEELVNYFRYDYPQPDGADPFSCALEVATCPWQTEHRLVRIGLKGKEITREARPPSNLVFLIDVSGSMAPPNRLALVKQCLRMLVDQLTAQDTVAIAVYAGASGCVLEPTSDRAKIREALDRLDAGGSTNGAAGIQLAYDLAQRSFKKGGTNRVILCTDGDFNVGITSQSELVSMIQGKARTGIFLSVLGFGMGNLKDSTLEKLADKGNGNYAYIDTLNEGRRVFVEQMSGTLITIAKDVKVQVEFNPAQVGAYRLVGYENRLLAKEDFNDDTKDAGEIGAGHTVTALYEIVPAGKAVPQQPPAADELKYQPRLRFAPEAQGVQPPASPAPGTPRQGDFKGEYYLLDKNQPQPTASPAAAPPAEVITRVAPSPELLTVKLRYKQPEGDVSKKLDFPLTDSGATWEKSSRDFRWAASVASFGLLLRDSPHKGSANWSLVEELAAEGKGDDRDGYRAEFVGLVEKAKALGR